MPELGPCAFSAFINARLKVLTNEKRGGLEVVSIDRSHFNLFTQRFSNKSMLTPSAKTVSVI